MSKRTRCAMTLLIALAVPAVALAAPGEEARAAISTVPAIAAVPGSPSGCGPTGAGEPAVKSPLGVAPDPLAAILRGELASLGSLPRAGGDPVCCQARCDSICFPCSGQVVVCNPPGPAGGGCRVICRCPPGC